MNRFDVWKQLTVVAMILMVVTWTVNARPPSKAISLAVIGTYESGIFDDSAAEIVAHDPATQRLFVTNAANGTIDILDISTPTDPQKITDFSVGGGGAEQRRREGRDRRGGGGSRPPHQPGDGGVL